MRHALSDIVGHRVEADGERLEVTEAWIDPVGGRLRYVGVDVGGWLSHRTALLSTGLLTWDEGWHADATRAEIEAAETDPDDGFDLSDLPPLVTGPFGNTFSPLMIAAGLRAEAEDEALPRPPDAEGPPVDADRLTRRLDRWSALRGTPVFARDGEIGPLIDLIHDDRVWDATALVVTAVTGREEIEWRHVRRRVESGGHMVLSADMAELGLRPSPLG